MKKLAEFIKQVEGGFRVISHQTGKNFGTYPTRGEAEKRLKQIHRFAKEESVGFGAGDEACRCSHGWAQHNQMTGRCSWCKCDSFHPTITEKISIDVEKGDTILGGRFKNHPIKINNIGKDDWDMPTVNGRKVVNFRIPKEKKDVNEFKNDEEDYPLQGKIYWKGIPIDVENARGSIRKGTDSDGHKWEIEMKHHYGRIRNTEAVDGDMLDVYVGPSDESEYVYKVKQLKPDTGEFDEHKYMLGFESPQEAHEAYEEQYDKPGFFGGLESIPFDEFKQLVKINQEKAGNK